ncbi:MAG: alpha-amylase family protein [Culicoidibacterales bacterium]
MEQLHTIQHLYQQFYGSFGAQEADFADLTAKMTAARKIRQQKFADLDQKSHDWYMSEQMVGTVFYVDLFANNLKELKKKIPYLQDLGVTYVHLMPLLKPRSGNSDGGYAVENYREINDVLGTMADFRAAIKALKQAGISVCIDFVVNHTAKEHEWAQKALAGDPTYQHMYLMYDTPEQPNWYNETVQEVLPDLYPGNFTYYTELQKYVFTSFSEFQWDLNFYNSRVFNEIVDILLFLANTGVEIIRLDAIPFMWKELGTMCRNLPKIHELLHLIHLIKDYVCPNLVLLGEAIVEPHEIVTYFGNEQAPECGLMYNATGMVNIWNALATRDVEMLRVDASRFYIPKTGTWMNYVRCHDDIGWGFNEELIQAKGQTPQAHKQFLIDFYVGRFPNSFAEGEIYQYNPVTHDARINGTLASLCGLGKALRDEDTSGVAIALKRIQMITAYLVVQPGIPLIYSGDELAQLNDHTYLQDPAKAVDGRWVHRPAFDWEKAATRTDETTAHGKTFQQTKAVIALRKNEPLLHAQTPTEILTLTNPAVHGIIRHGIGEKLVCLFNFAESVQVINPHQFGYLPNGEHGVNLETGEPVSFAHQTLTLVPYEYKIVKIKE